MFLFEGKKVKDICIINKWKFLLKLIIRVLFIISIEKILLVSFSWKIDNFVMFYKFFEIVLRELIIVFFLSNVRLWMSLFGIYIFFNYFFN